MVIKHIRLGQYLCVAGIAAIVGLQGCLPNDDPAEPDVLDVLAAVETGSRACERPRRVERVDSLRLTEQTYDCLIESLRPNVTFSAGIADTFPSPGRRGVRLRGGRYVTEAGHASEHRLLLWDSTGAFITSYKRTGQGPGELPDNLGVYFLLTNPGRDTLYVVDGRNRWSVFSPDLEFVRSFQAKTVRSEEGLAVTDNGLILSTAPLGSDFRVQAFGLDGSLIREFKPADPSVEPERYSSEAIAYAGNGLFWIANLPGTVGDLVLEQWSTDGTLTRTIRRPTPGVSPSGFKVTVSPNDVRMFPTYPLFTVDPDGLLWILGVVPDWALRDKTEHAFDRQVDEAPPLDGRLEVIDPSAGRILASALIDVGADDPFNSMLAGTSSIFTSVEDSLGLTTLELRELRLVRK